MEKVGAAEAAECPGLLVRLAQLAPDRQAALVERQRGVTLALHLQHPPQPLHDAGQRCAALIGGQLGRPLQPAAFRPKASTISATKTSGHRLDSDEADGRATGVTAC
jgi:hypothetical protein